MHSKDRVIGYCFPDASLDIKKTPESLRTIIFSQPLNFANAQPSRNDAGQERGRLAPTVTHARAGGIVYGLGIKQADASHTSRMVDAAIDVSHKYTQLGVAGIDLYVEELATSQYGVLTKSIAAIKAHLPAHFSVSLTLRNGFDQTLAHLDRLGDLVNWLTILPPAGIPFPVAKLRAQVNDVRTFPCQIFLGITPTEACLPFPRFEQFCWFVKENLDRCGIALYGLHHDDTSQGYNFFTYTNNALHIMQNQAS